MKQYYLFYILVIIIWYGGHGNRLYAQQQSIAFLGQGATYTDNIPTAADGFTYEDDRAAAVWFMDTFLPAHSNITGTYYSFQDVAEGADISDYDLLWIQCDGATYPERLNEWPRGTQESNGDQHCVIRETGFEWNGAGLADGGACVALENAFITSIRNYYESGGNVFLGNYAGKALEVLGVFDGLSNPWEYRPNQTFGDVTVNTSNTAAPWGTHWSGPVALVNGINLVSATECTFAMDYLEFLTADTEKKNRACQYNLNWGRIHDDTPSGVLSDKRTTFETTLQATILLENCDGNEIQGALFSPNSAGDGTVIWYGAGVYDWYALGTGSNAVVKDITENALLYLLNSTLNTKELVEQSINIYPNPANQKIFLESNLEAELTLYNFLGQVIETTRGNVLDVTHVANGWYVLQVTSDTGQRSFKKIKVQHL